MDVFKRTCGICNGWEPNDCPRDFEFNSQQLCHLQEPKAEFFSFFINTGRTSIEKEYKPVFKHEYLHAHAEFAMTGKRTSTLVRMRPLRYPQVYQTQNFFY